ncbi:uncharacterized protein [Diadema antillarum]|uniref:uncharacterized protein n=1 Tax=Diadema antillarum TaxID=105358 RepID=UPI003A83DE5E
MSSSYPKWLSDIKHDLTESREWQNLREELRAVIDQQLTESRVDRFDNLSDAERKMFLERALRALKNSDHEAKFSETLYTSVNEHINSFVSRQLLDGSGFPLSSTKSDLVIDQANDASATLLTRWPEMKSKLHRCFNRPLPTGLRQVAWRLFLSNPTVKSRYLSRLERDPESTMSILDLDIVQKCDALLQSEPTFKSLAFKSDVLHTMKAVLSYHHACKQTRTGLLDTDYLLVVPFLVNALGLAAAGPGSRRGGLETEGHPINTKETMALIVEQYSTLMSTRPAYMKESYDQDFKESMRLCSSKLAGTLHVYDSDLAGHLLSILSKDGKNLPLAESLKQITRPMIRSIFVGYLSLEAVLFIWDQHVIGLDAPEFDVIPPIMVLILLLHKTQLMECQTATDVMTVMKQECPRLKKEQLMHGINKHFHRELYSLMVKDGGVPVLDPTQMPTAWQEWHKEDLPPVIRPEDRQLSRQRREEEHLRDLQMQKEREEERLRANQAREEQEKARLQRKLDDAKRTYHTKEEELVEQLNEEKRKREEATRQANEEIEKLKRELSNLKKGLEDKPEPIPPAKVGQDLLKGIMKAAASATCHPGSLLLQSCVGNLLSLLSKGTTCTDLPLESSPRNLESHLLAKEYFTADLRGHHHLHRRNLLLGTCVASYFQLCPDNPLLQTWEATTYDPFCRNPLQQTCEVISFCYIRGSHG